MLRIGQVEPSATADGKYTDGSVAGGIAATRLRAAAFNAMQEELANIVESAGMSLSPDDMAQVLTALKKQLLSRSNPFADIKADGTAAVAMALSNLGLGEAAKHGVATSEQMATGTATDLLPSVAAVMSLFNKRTFALQDYIRIPDVPGGIIIQWGTTPGTDASGLTKATLPIAFPKNNGLVCLANFYSGTRTAIFTQVVSITQTEVSFYCSGQQGGPAQYAPVRYIVIGN